MARMDCSHTPLTLSDSESSSRITRIYGEELQRDIVTVSTSPVVDGIMKLVGGLFAVLNADRQILAVNDTFLNEMGVGEGAEVLGLRMGEAIRCIHAGDGPGSAVRENSAPPAVPRSRLSRALPATWRKNGNAPPQSGGATV